MPDSTENHRGKWVVSGPIHSPFINACISVCNQAETGLQQSTCEKGVETAMALPQLFTPKYQEETYTMTGQAGFLGELAF